MISYKNDPKLKRMMVAEMKIHKKQDAFIKGTYAKENGVFKGCAVGCSIRSLNTKLGKNIGYGDHLAYETELGIPEWLAHLEDHLFENLPDKERKSFPVEFLEAIPVGINLEPVQFKFQKFLLQENFKRVEKLKDLDQAIKDQVLAAINQVIAVMAGAIKTGKIDESARSAESAAWSAAESAARSAWSAAWSAKSAAESAAWSAAWSAARFAARSAAYVRYKTQLLKLLKECK